MCNPILVNTCLIPRLAKTDVEDNCSSIVVSDLTDQNKLRSPGYLDLYTNKGKFLMVEFYEANFYLYCH